MKQLFLSLILAMIGMVLAGNVVDAQCVNAQTKMSDNQTQVPKGELPPRWLLNKVTPTQYDTLAALNKICAVDYSMLKGYDVTPADVARLMEQARIQMHKALDNTDGVTTHVGWKAFYVKTVRPWSDKTEKGLRRVEYMVYSSVDGYDVHLLLRATLQRNRHTSGYYSVDYDLVPYSVQGIPVQVEHARVTKGGPEPVSRLEIGKGVKSTGYAVNATLRFTDPLGNKCCELVETSIHFVLDQ